MKIKKFGKMVMCKCILMGILIGFLVLPIQSYAKAGGGSGKPEVIKIKGKQGNQGERGIGLKNRVELQGEIILVETRKTIWSVYVGHDVRNENSFVGAKMTFRFGKSYTEKRLDELERKLNQLLSKE